MFIQKIYSGQDAGMGIIKEINIRQSFCPQGGYGSAVRCDIDSQHTPGCAKQREVSAQWEIGGLEQGRKNPVWVGESERHSADQFFGHLIK